MIFELFNQSPVQEITQPNHSRNKMEGEDKNVLEIVPTSGGGGGSVSLYETRNSRVNDREVGASLFMVSCRTITPSYLNKKLIEIRT